MAVLQVALDFLELDRALECAREAVKGGADWLEAGTPLIKSEGLDSVRALKKEFPRQTIVADMKTLDAGRIEMEAAAKAGAQVAVVSGAANESTVLECVEAGRNYGVKVALDLLGAEDPVGLAKRALGWGVSIIGVHASIDEQMRGEDPFAVLREVAGTVRAEVSVAGGINSETAPDAVKAGADIVIVGGAITKSARTEEATSTIKRAMETGVSVKTELYRRATEKGIREILLKVSTANLSDGFHRGGVLEGIRPISTGVQMAGPAVTVRTYPGDWAKTVEAIDVARENDVIVIDAGGVPPAVWGELASESSVGKKLAGVVIDGAIRDTKEVRSLGFAAFARHVCPDAGEPKGFGEINLPVKVGGRRVEPGDWMLGDDDGVVAIPRLRAAELANRGMDVLEKENRLREEIRRGHTLSEVAQLLRWEKTR